MLLKEKSNKTSLVGKEQIMDKKIDFNNISITGRIAYSIMCAEKYAITKYPNKDWKRLFSWMWESTSSYLDDWYYKIIEILPEYLYEFNNYEESNFEYLSQKDYTYFYHLLKDIDENMNDLLTIPTEIATIYAYTSIPGKGQESIKLVEKAITILKTNNIQPPDINEIEFCSFSEKNGWGEQFDGSKLSNILK